MNSRILVTGATGGVGTALCRYLVDKYQVIAVSRNSQLLSELYDDNPSITTFKCDLADHKEVSQLIEFLISNYEYIPYIVNNAGVNLSDTLEQLSREDLETSLAINSIAPFLIMQGLLPEMRRKNYGRIINITSGAPMNCFAGFGAYSASKAALNALTVTAAREQKDYDIKINLMSPGPVRSGMSPSATMDPEVCLPTFEYLLNLDINGPTGRFFWLGHELPLFPDHQGVDWLRGSASGAYQRIS